MRDKRETKEERREKREERGEKREERREKREAVLRERLRITAIPMRCGPNFGLTQVEPELGHYLA